MLEELFDLRLGLLQPSLELGRSLGILSLVRFEGRHTIQQLSGLSVALLDDSVLRRELLFEGCQLLLELGLELRPDLGRFGKLGLLLLLQLDGPFEELIDLAVALLELRSQLDHFGRQLLRAGGKLLGAGGQLLRTSGQLLGMCGELGDAGGKVFDAGGKLGDLVRPLLFQLRQGLGRSL